MQHIVWRAFTNCYICYTNSIVLAAEDLTQIATCTMHRQSTLDLYSFAYT